METLSQKKPDPEQKVFVWLVALAMMYFLIRFVLG